MPDPTSEQRVEPILQLNFRNKPSKRRCCEFIVLALSYSTTLRVLLKDFVEPEG